MLPSRLHASALLVSLSLLVVSTAGFEQLTVVSPTNLYPGTSGVVYQKPSLFGLPNFREKIVGQVIWPARDTNPLGCSPYTSFIPEDSGGSPPSLIALIDRGNCTFATKVQHAQDAGAQAVIIVNIDATYGTYLPYMGAGPEGKSINIPAMIIRGSDGDIFKANVDSAGGGLQVSMSYFLPNPDDRVEFDFYTYANDPLSKPFQSQFKKVVSALNSHVLFEPHYQYQNWFINSFGYYSSCKVPSWVSGGCTQANLNARCGNKCINCGRYCAVDPDGSSSTGASGADVVLEQLRQKCVWKYGNDTTPNSNTIWFDYVNQHGTACASTPYDATCGNNLATQLGVPSSYLTSCMGTTGPLVDSNFPLLDAEVTWQAQFGQLPPPELYVNQQPYHGALECTEPIGTTCPPLQMICAGFSTGTAPSACETSPGCELGVMYDSCDVCGGDNSTCTGCDGVVKSGKVMDACGDCLLRTDVSFIEDKDACPSTESSKSFPVGIVIGVVLAAVVLIGLGVWFYLRRQQHKMKDDIDSLLKQYLPMSDGTNSLEPPPRRVDQSRLLATDGSDQNQL